jgi:serine phosphatase RsbU (regulator of sigma subunit)
VQAEVLTTRSNLPDWPISDCRRDLERAIALAEPAGQFYAAFRAHNNLGDLLARQLGQQEQAYQHFMRAAELCRQQGFVREELFVRLNVVRLLTNRFELDRAEENLQIIRFRLAIVIEDERDGIYVDFRQAVLDWLRGNLSKALAGLERIRHLARRVRDLDNWFLAVWELLWIQVDAHFWGHAVDLDDLYELGHGLLQDEFSAQFYAYAMQSTICSLRGEVDEARHYLTAAQQIMAPDWPNEWLFVEFSRFYILLAEDQQDQALVVLEELLNSSILDALLVEKTRARSYQAELYRRRGRPVDLEEARRIFREIEQFTGQVGVRYYQQIAHGRLEMLRQEMLNQAVDHEQVSREMANAGRVQASFLPQVLPEVSGWELAAKLSPARQTSGDFYDFIPLPEDRLAFLVADVADKGAGAALFMALTHGLLRTYTAAYPDDPAHVLFETNQRLLADSSRALFVTLFYGVLEVQTGQLAYCNAGHNPPYYVPAESHHPLQLLALTGIPLGIDPDATWQNRELALQPDGLLVLYTDGVTEAQNKDGAYFGEEPLEERLQASRGASAQTVLDALSADLAAFVGAAPQTDDITLLVLRRADRAT